MIVFFFLTRLRASSSNFRHNLLFPSKYEFSELNTCSLMLNFGIYSYLYCMAVRLGKYSGSLGVCARKYVFCAKTILMYAEKFFSWNIYITCAEKYLYECENIYLTAQKFFGLRRNLWACAKVFSPSAENYVMRGNILKSRNFILFCAEIITSHAQ